MLYTDPLVEGAGPSGEPRYVRIFRSTLESDFGVHADVHAFHWGGLTSANRLTALWVLLLPFSLANLAGWAARARSRWTITWVRLFGLVLTGVFINLAVTTGVDVYWHRSAGWEEGRVAWVMAIFTALAVLWWVLVSEASTRSHFERLTFVQRQRLLWLPRPEALDPPAAGPDAAATWDDPAAADITDEVMWTAHPIVHRLRRLHFGFGYLVLGFSAAVASDTGWGPDGWPVDFPTLLPLVLLFASAWALATTGLRPGAGRLLQWVTLWHPVVGAAVAGLAILTLAAGVESGVDWPHLHDTSAMLVVVGGAALLGAWISGGKVTAGSLTLGALFGLVFGAGTTLALADMTHVQGFRVGGVNWLATGVLVWLLAIIVIVGLTLAANTRHSAERIMWYSIHTTTGRLTSLFVAMPAAAVLVVGFVLWQRCATAIGSGVFQACIQEGELPDRLPAGTGTLVVVLTVLAALALAGFLLVTGAKVPALIVTAATAAILILQPSVTILGVDLAFSDIEATAVTFAVLLPAALIARRLTVGIMPGGAESRRGTGVIWDVVMFWPRWFHPLAPPAYGPHAVTRLRQEITERAGVEAPRSRRRPLIVAAHSQGTIIALVAMALVGGARRLNPHQFEVSRPQRLGKLGLLTYGSPVGHLYHRYFPSAGFIHLGAALAEGLGAYGEPGAGRWVNLYRRSDPIGGPVVPAVDVEVTDPETVPDGGPPAWRLHSRYEPTAAFRLERTRIDGLVTEGESS
jgi:hypothetical protein